MANLFELFKFSFREESLSNGQDPPGPAFTSAGRTSQGSPDLLVEMSSESTPTSLPIETAQQTIPEQCLIASITRDT